MKNNLFMLILLCCYSNVQACYDPALSDSKNATNCLKLAEQGHADAQFQLGQLYTNRADLPTDMQAAEAWYLKSAESGYADAQFALGLIYENRIDTREAPAPAFTSLSSLSSLGETDNIGISFDLCLEIGDGPIDAIKWYRLAAIQGHAGAQLNLGWIYAKGHGVPADNMLAYMWFDIAAKDGQQDAYQYRDEVSMRLSPELTEEALKLADAWRLEHREDY